MERKAKEHHSSWSPTLIDRLVCASMTHCCRRLSIETNILSEHAGLYPTSQMHEGGAAAARQW